MLIIDFPYFMIKFVFIMLTYDDSFLYGLLIRFKEVIILRCFSDMTFTISSLSNECVHFGDKKIYNFII